MSFRQEDHAAAAARRAFQISSLSRTALIAILIGILGYCAWQGLSFFMEHANTPDSASLVGLPTAPPEAARPAQQAKITTDRPAEEREDVEKEDELQAVMVSGESGPRPTPAKEWRLRGKVYDLETLRPVPGCAMVFLDAQTNARYQTSTDARGLYRMIVPPLQSRGYAVRISHGGYASSYLNPGVENIPQMPREERRQLSQEIANSLEPPYTVQPYGSKPLVTDFYIAPLAGGERP